MQSISTADSLNPLRPVIEWKDDINRSYTTVHVVTWDRAGLFYKLAGAFSVAYSLRLIHDTFFNGPPGDMPHMHPHEPPVGMKAPVALLAAICLAVGLLPAALFGPMVQVAATAMTGKALPEYHLAIWHGFNLPLLMSAIALAAGAGLYFLLASGKRMHRIESETWFGPATGRQIFEGLIDGQFALAGLTQQRQDCLFRHYLAPGSRRASRKSTSVPSTCRSTKWNP